MAEPRPHCDLCDGTGRRPLTETKGRVTPHPHLRILALASLRRWPGTRWFVWLPAPSRTRPGARPWIVATRQAPVVDFFRAVSRT